MDSNFGWAHAGPAVLASFLASMVECVEALTVILAVGAVRGWRGALSGSAVALGVLTILLAALGKALIHLPLHIVQFAVGTLLLLFGLRWLRKAILRAAGLVPLHDEKAAFSKNTEVMRRLGKARRWDKVAFAACFQITMLEGTEVVFIVIAVGAGGAGLLLPASIGAFAALIVVLVLGFALHRPLSAVPENILKFAVGILLSAFGTFWAGEGIGGSWPGADWTVAGLLAGFLAISLLTVFLCRKQASLGVGTVHP